MFKERKKETYNNLDINQKLKNINISKSIIMKNYRIESDLLGELQVPKDAYYGVQTQRAVDNFYITGQKWATIRNL